MGIAQVWPRLPPTGSRSGPAAAIPLPPCRQREVQLDQLQQILSFRHWALLLKHGTEAAR